MSSSRTKPGTKRLSEVARYVVKPSGIVTTGYPQVAARCRQMGIGHDEWQRGLGRLILAKRKDGKYAATVGGVTMSIPRQVGKTYTVGSILFALCIDNPGLTVIWTAHRTRTSNETFASLKGMSQRAKVRPHMLPPRSTNGEQEIRFRNGSRILFGAREQGFGRGFAAVDVIVFDEAQILTSKALEDMVAATNQARHPAGALLFYMGTPPRPGIDPGEAFTAKRTKALSGKGTDGVYVEISAEPGASPDDWAQVSKANPSYPHRTPRESILRLRENLPDVESYLREGMGIWPEDDVGWAVFTSVAWAGRARKSRTLPGTPSIALAASPDLAWAAFGAANLRGVETWGKVLAHGPGVAWVVERAKALQQKHRSPIVLDKGGPCSSLIDELESAGVDLRLVNSSGVADAEAMFYQLVQERGTFRDASSPALSGVFTEAARIAAWRPMADRRVLDRKVGDITTVEAVALAAFDAASNNYDVDDSIG